MKPWPWADSWPIGRLRQPRLGVDLIVLEGASGEALAFGPGRLEGGSQLSENKHSVLAGHRDTSFIFLQNVQHGDKITVESLTTQDTYTVESTEIVAANELYLDREKPQTLSLITCYPFDSVLPQTTMRYLVTASGATRAITTPEQNFLVNRRLLKAPFVRKGSIPVAGNIPRILHQDLLHGL